MSRSIIGKVFKTTQEMNISISFVESLGEVGEDDSSSICYRRRSLYMAIMMKLM